MSPAARHTSVQPNTVQPKRRRRPWRYSTVLVLGLVALVVTLGARLLKVGVGPLSQPITWALCYEAGGTAVASCGTAVGAEPTKVTPQLHG